MAATEILPAFSYACGMISAKLSHGERVLLENVFFSLSSGERLAVIGETGSGKTMLALSILGLLPSNVRMQGGCLQLDGAGAPRGKTAAGAARRQACLYSAKRRGISAPCAYRAQTAL